MTNSAPLRGDISLICSPGSRRAASVQLGDQDDSCPSDAYDEAPIDVPSHYMVEGEETAYEPEIEIHEAPVYSAALYLRAVLASLVVFKFKICPARLVFYHSHCRTCSQWTMLHAKHKSSSMATMPGVVGQAPASVSAAAAMPQPSQFVPGS